MLVEDTKKFIFQHLHSKIEIGNIGNEIGVNTTYLSELFHKNRRNHDSEIHSKRKNQACKEYVTVFGIQDRRHSKLSRILFAELFWKGFSGVRESDTESISTKIWNIFLEEHEENGLKSQNECVTIFTKLDITNRKMERRCGCP